jgi:hypothetical protein
MRADSHAGCVSVRRRPLHCDIPEQGCEVHLGPLRIRVKRVPRLPKVFRLRQPAFRMCSALHVPGVVKTRFASCHRAA